MHDTLRDWHVYCLRKLWTDVSTDGLQVADLSILLHTAVQCTVRGPDGACCLLCHGWSLQRLEPAVLHRPQASCVYCWPAVCVAVSRVAATTSTGVDSVGIPGPSLPTT
jgi:hypothetical protein